MHSNFTMHGLGEYKYHMFAAIFDTTCRLNVDMTINDIVQVIHFKDHLMSSDPSLRQTKQWAFGGVARVTTHHPPHLNLEPISPHPTY